VCGHIGCGGVAAASSTTPVGIAEIDRWLDPLRMIRQDHYNMITGLAAADQQPALVKLSVQRSLAKLATIPAVANAMAVRPMQLHGAIYTVGTGALSFLSPADTIEPPSESLFDLTKYYRLTNKSGGTGKFLDIQGGILDAGGTGGGWPNQSWKFSPVGDGSFMMSTAGLIGYVASSNGMGKPLTVITPAAPSTNAGQRWRITKADDGVSFFLTSDLGGPTERLDVNQSTFQPPFFPKISTGTTPGQYWTLTPV
jgi:Carbonic anhydrase